MRYWKRTAILLVLLALGFTLGWFVDPVHAPVSPVPKTEGSGALLSTKKSLEGFCCITAGSPCERIANAGACFLRKGEVFNSNQELCDLYCTNAQ